MPFPRTARLAAILTIAATAVAVSGTTATSTPTDGAHADSARAAAGRSGTSRAPAHGVRADDDVNARAQARGAQPSEPAAITDDVARIVQASAFVVTDLRTGGRIVREQRGEWLDTPVWPGSIAKLATLAAAIDAGTLTDSTRIVCTRRVTVRGGRRADCSHRPIARGLSAVEAIAYSCNAFAAAIARTLTRAQFVHGFEMMGLTPPPADADILASAIGLEGAKVAPRRLIEPILRISTRAQHEAERLAAPAAPAAPAAAPDAPSRATTSPDARNVENGENRERASREPRARLLFEGLRESARHGTASAFGDAGIDALAKTGTAPMRGGQPLGLVAAIAPADAPRYAIVVAVPGGSGAHAAEAAAAILAPLLASGQVPKLEPASRILSAPSAPLRIGRPTATTGYTIATLALEDYVSQVVAGETSSATPLVVREALAITARTYAEVNRGRHHADGFDLCTLTHCQVTRPASAASRAAADRTRGRLLVRDAVGGRPAAEPTRGTPAAGAAATPPAAAAPSARAAAPAASSVPAAVPVPIPVFYSASCGGTLADVRALLPDAVPGAMPWLAARPDPAGIEESETRWHAEIPARDLLSALQQAGFRGDTLRHLSVRRASAPRTAAATTTSTDRAGTATASATADGLVTDVIVDGLTPSTLSADTFRRIVGQRLGWQLLKSLRFTVDRTAAGYRFTGRGHGHGVGLCVLGASALAARGMDATRILQSYFPGLQLSAPLTPQQASIVATAVGNDTAPTPAIHLRLPEADERHRARVTRLLDTGLRDLTARLDVTASDRPPDRLTVVVHPTGDSYRRATGRPWWTAGATLVSGDAITLHLAPLDALERAGRLERTLRHELVHVLTVRALAERPRWVHEGLARYFAGERVTVDPADAPRVVGPCPSDRELLRAPDRAAFEGAYDRATACVARDLAAGRSWRDLGATRSN